MPDAIRQATRIALLAWLMAAAFPTCAAMAQSGSAGGSIGNEEKSLSGSREAPRAVEPSKPTRRAKPESDEPRRASRKSGGEGAGGGGNFDGTWVSVALGSPCGSATERFVISGGTISGELSSGSVSPERREAERRVGPGLELDQHGAILGPYRRRFVRAMDGCPGRWTASKQ